MDNSKNKVQLFAIEDKVQTFDANVPLFKEQIKKNLDINIYKNVRRYNMEYFWIFISFKAIKTNLC